MAMTDAAMRALCEAMTEYGAGIEFELQLGELVGRYRRAHDARMRDAEAARLLPQGWPVVCEILGVKKSTVYKMNRRARSTVRAVAVDG